MPPLSNTPSSEDYYQLGNQLRREGRLAEAEKALQRAIEVDPAYRPPYISLAYMHHYEGNRVAATAILRALGERSGQDLVLRRQVAGLLADFGYADEALRAYQGLCREQPADAALQLAMGRTLQALGQAPEAAAAFRRATDLNPDLGAAWLLLAQVRHGRVENTALAQRYRAALDRRGLSKDTLICLQFGLGKICDELGLYPEAFEHFQRGNELWHEDHPFDRKALVESSAAVQRCFAGFRPPLPLPGEPTPQPVFVIGMLRSGTTLVERIIARHPLVYGLGETELADTLAGKTAEITGIPYPDSVAALSAAQRIEFAAQFRMQWPAPASQARIVADKNPLNFLHLGLLAQLFPAARFVHCVRDPLDTCLSIYFQHFAHRRNSYAYDLDDIGFFYRQYRAVMSLWKSVLSDQNLRQVSYAELVAQPEREIRALINWLGLDWDPSCLSPHLHAGQIHTASAWQAREPIHGGAVGRSRHYEPYLSRLRGALE